MQTGGGLDPDADAENNAGAASQGGDWGQRLPFYVPWAGPDENTPDSALNLWGMPAFSFKVAITDFFLKTKLKRRSSSFLDFIVFLQHVPASQQL